MLGLPLLGASVVVAARRLLPGDGGHAPLDGISVEPTPLRYGPGVALAAIGTLAFGPVLGPEAPLIALGSVVGLAVAPLVRLGREEQAVLATAGSFSAISALFGGPLVAGLLLLEAGSGLGAALIGTLLPGLVAAAIGYLVFVGLGDWGGLEQTALVVPDLPAYQGTHLLDLLVGLLVGVATALLVAFVRRAATAVTERGEPRLGMSRLLLAGGLAVGLAGAAGRSARRRPARRSVLRAGGDTRAREGGLGRDRRDPARRQGALRSRSASGAASAAGRCSRRSSSESGWRCSRWSRFDVSPTLAVAVGTAAGTAAMARLLFARCCSPRCSWGRRAWTSSPPPCSRRRRHGSRWRRSIAARARRTRALVESPLLTECRDHSPARGPSSSSRASIALSRAVTSCSNSSRSS